MAYTVLVVEDDEVINEVISEYLKASGYIVISCKDGGEAKVVIKANEEIDLYLLDIMLPGYSGIELLKMIRELNKKPVIMLTALGDEKVELESFELRADDYISKPFSAKIMLKRVESVLRRSAGDGGGGVLEMCGVKIDFDSYEVYEEGEKKDLTLKEYEILKMLMINSRRVLSRSQLLNGVWGYNYFGDERIVDVHIKNLRKKFRGDFIVTVKGVGYRIDG